MREIRFLFYCIWRSYALDVFDLSTVFAVTRFPESKLKKLVCLIRLKIAIALTKEANRAFDYSTRFIEDRNNEMKGAYYEFFGNVLGILMILLPS